MEKNQIVKKLQKILNLDSEEIYEIFRLNGYKLPRSRIDGYLSDKDEKCFLDLGYEALGNFLDGLIIYKRGELYRRDDKVERLTNNRILKKLRVAFDLKQRDLFDIFKSVDIDITKGELSSLFRSEDHKKFRYCPDSILELFLDGLENFVDRSQ